MMRRRILNLGKISRTASDFRTTDSSAVHCCDKTLNNPCYIQTGLQSVRPPVPRRGPYRLYLLMRILLGGGQCDSRALLFSSPECCCCLALSSTRSVCARVGEKKAIVAHLRASHTSEECLKEAARRGALPRNLR